MQNRLKEKQIEKISEKYSTHPLYMTCRYAFKRNEAQMPVLRFATEEVFAEAAEVIDNVIIDREDIEDYLQLLWDELITKICLWEPQAQIQLIQREQVLKLFVTIFEEIFREVYLILMILKL